MDSMTKIGSLPNGTKVIFYGLETTYKDVVVLHSNPSGAAVKGMHRESESDAWKPLGANHTVSNETDVLIDNGSTIEAPAEETPEVIKPKNTKTTLALPEGEWTIKQLAALNDISPANAYIRLHNHGGFRIVGKRSGGRGKPTIIYTKE